MSAPKLWAVAGPNGAGKTTLTRHHLTGHLPVVNPDDIAAEIDIVNRNTATCKCVLVSQQGASHAADS